MTSASCHQCMFRSGVRCAAEWSNPLLHTLFLFHSIHSPLLSSLGFLQLVWLCWLQTKLQQPDTSGLKIAKLKCLVIFIQIGSLCWCPALILQKEGQRVRTGRKEEGEHSLQLLSCLKELMGMAVP